MDRRLERLSRAAIRQIEAVTTQDMMAAGFTLKNAFIEERAAILAILKKGLPDCENVLHSMIEQADDVSGLSTIVPGADHSPLILFVFVVLCRRLGIRKIAT